MAMQGLDFVECSHANSDTDGFGDLPLHDLSPGTRLDRKGKDRRTRSEPSLPAFLGADVRLGSRDPLNLRESYRSDLRAVKKVTDFRYVRFHAILHDEVGVYDEDEHGNPVYNFSYVDQIYDGLLKNGVRPFVEISFMPKKLAFRQDAPSLLVQAERLAAEGLAKWDELMRALRAAPGRSLRHRRGRAVVLRGVERAEHRFLDRRSEAGYLLRALRPHRARAEGGESAAARGRSGDFVGTLGRRFPTACRDAERAGRFRVDPRLRRRHRRGSIRHARRHSRWTSASAARSRKCTTRSRRRLRPTCR